MRRRRKSRPARRSGRQQTQRDVDGGDQTREAGDGGRVASRIRLGARETRDGGWEPEAGRRVDEVNGRCRGVVGVRLLRRGRRSERGRARVQGGGRRAHDCASRLGGCRAAPIRRLETAIGGGGGVAAEAVRAMSPAEADDAREVVTRGLAVVPGFDDKNFQVLGRVFEILGALADKAAGFSKPDGARVVSGAAQKVADVKLRGPATAALMSVTEALGPKFVVAQLHKHTATHKNPKVTAEALLFCASTVGEFGVETHDVAFNISWCKSSLGASNPACKSAAGKFLGAMHAGLGPALRDFLSDLKDTQMKNLDAELRVTLTSPGRNPRGPFARRWARARPPPAASAAAAAEVFLARTSPVSSPTSW